MSRIKFGTDGWRAEIAGGFTFDNVCAATRAVARFLEEEGRGGRGVVVGFDTRFLSEEFAARAVLVLLERGIKVYLCPRPAPTPAVAYAVSHLGCDGALMFTASHNPPRYHGLKYIPHYAGPALPRETDRIGELVAIEQHKAPREKNAAGGEKEHLLPALINLLETARKGDPLPSLRTDLLPASTEPLELIEPADAYLEHLRELINTAAIREASPTVAVDPLHGAARGYLEAFFVPLGCRVEVIRGERDPFFGGSLPDPSEENLSRLKELVQNIGAAAGLALDGDGDRLGVISSRGNFLNANQLLTLFLEHLLENRGWRGKTARTVATTHNLDRLAEAGGLEVLETPVGFKYIGEAMRRGGVILGGEESGGLSIRGHIPEKDGIMAALLYVEMLCCEGLGAEELFERIGKKVELLSSKRWDLHTTPAGKEEVLQRLGCWEPGELRGLKVQAIRRLDGVKVLLAEGSWCLVRPSGTEDLFRLYVEAPSREMVEKLGSAVRSALFEGVLC